MKFSLTAALVLAGSLGAASAALAATHAVEHPAHAIETTKASPVKVMSEKPDSHPGLSGALMASDGALYTPAAKDPRIHGLPEY